MKGRKPVLGPQGADVVDLPASAVRVPPCPPELKTDRQKQAWDKHARMMVAKNIYDVDCESMLMAYCVQYAIFTEALDHVGEEGLIFKPKSTPGRGGERSLQYNMWNSILRKSYDQMVRLAAEMGLTPVARKRVHHTRGVATGYLRSGKAKNQSSA